MDKNLEAMWENCLFFMRDNLASSEEGSDMKKLEDSFALLFDNIRPKMGISEKESFGRGRKGEMCMKGNFGRGRRRKNAKKRVSAAAEKVN